MSVSGIPQLEEPGAARHERRDEDYRDDEHDFGCVDRRVRLDRETGSSVLRLRAARTRMKVLMGINSSAKTSAKSPIFTQKKPLYQ
jgi:hypothetical protein